MPLSWNEIKERAAAFSKEWENAKNEDSEAKSFWDDLFNVFGVNRRRVATFEYKVTKASRNDGYIDLLWKGVLLVEHKSAGKNLDMAYQQAIDYFPGLKDHDLPKYICVCDFQNFRIIDLDDNSEVRFSLKDLVANVHQFGFLAGYQKRTFKDLAPINIEAAYRMGKLHDELKRIGYDGHELEVYLVRILYCLFAEDTSIFEKNLFRYFIELKTKDDGSDLGAMLAQLFQILNTPANRRLTNLDEDLSSFPYVNGMLFAEQLSIASFTKKMRDILLDCTALDWTKISPAIFGSMFQSVLNDDERRNLGAHYTSEKNIMKVIKPLFLDELWDEFNTVKNNINQLKAFHKKISTLKFLDPACGCGNFLVISYRELRLLELEILKVIYKSGQLSTNIDDIVWISLNQFYGIEIEEWPCRIAEVAMWLMEHQMNMRLSDEFGQYFIRLPLGKSANITNANALRIDWNSLLDPLRSVDIYARKANIIQAKEPKIEYGEVNVYADSFEIVEEAPKKIKSDLHFDYILGNPPFVGAMMMNVQQRADIRIVSNNTKHLGVLDYVSAWYLKSAKYLSANFDRTKVAFVSTNSLSQGEQVGILWQELLKYSIKIHFAHRTFKWNNEAKGVAAVHVIIIGFSNFDISNKYLYDYDDIKDEPHFQRVNNINPYLVEGKDMIVSNMSEPICNAPIMRFGSMPRDGGNLIFTKEEKDDFIKIEPNSKSYFRPYTGAKEYLHGYTRFCLWLVNAEPNEIQKLPEVLKRIELVKNFRLNSKAKTTQLFALTPSIFCQIAQPSIDYLLIPRVSSEKRKYIPIGFVHSNTIANDQVLTLEEASFFHFGVLTSLMHMTWVKYVCGRLKSDYRYSKDIVYNNYPWPENPTEQQKEAIEKAAQKVLDARVQFPNSSLAELYDPLTMPAALLKAHQELDKAVDLAYRKEPYENESKRIEYLFALYEKYTSGLFNETKKKG